MAGRTLNSRTQLNVASPEALRRDLGRLIGDIDELVAALRNVTVPRWQFGERVTAATSRPGLRFSELRLVDTRDGSVRLYLPRATSRDAGLQVGFIKQISTGAVHLQDTSGALINGQPNLDNLTQIGLHWVLWDGTTWWLREPAARIQRHTTLHNPVGLWQFDRTLADEVNGNDFTVSAGTIIYSDVMGLRCAWFDAATTLTVTDAVLQITGDLTIETLMVLDAGPNGNPWISHGAAGETEATNIIYEAQVEVGRLLTWFHERGAGINETFTWGTDALPPVHQLFHLAHVRSSNSVQNYVNGRPLGDPQPFNAATGGTSGALVVGGSSAAAAIASFMFLGSLKICNTALTSAQVMAEYNLTLGGAYGYADQFGAA